QRSMPKICPIFKKTRKVFENLAGLPSSPQLFDICNVVPQINRICNPTFDNERKYGKLGLINFTDFFSTERNRPKFGARFQDSHHDPIIQPGIPLTCIAKLMLKSSQYIVRKAIVQPNVFALTDQYSLLFGWKLLEKVHLLGVKQ